MTAHHEANRLEQLKHWLAGHLAGEVSAPQPITNDASFRRYFRVIVNGISHIVMDAPPDKENCQPFVEVAHLLRHAGLNVPEVLAENLETGFLLLTDLGNDLYLPHLSEARVERLYGDALGALAVMQACVDAKGLPPYDQVLLHQEMNLLPDWLLAKHLQLTLSAAETTQLQACFEFLSAAALAQPQVFVHRDYHSRNLLLTAQHNPGILDFQDAVRGAVTYDLVSLLRDCYVVWPRARVNEWVTGYYELALQTGILPEAVGDETFLRWFDLMGLQRHVKVAGIFARLYHRDGKAGYLQDIPTALRYIVEVGQDYPQTAFLAELVKTRILPAVLENRSATHV